MGKLGVGGTEEVSRQCVKVTFYDNICLKLPGEYIIRGQVHSTLEGDGFIEPIYFPDADLIVASCLVAVDESKIVPLRVWTLKEDTKIKKSQNVALLQFNDEKTSVKRMNMVSTDKINRWNVLWPQLQQEVDRLSEEYKSKLIPLLKEYSDIFSVTKNDIGLTSLVEHEIDTGNVKPIACQYRRIPFGLEEKVDNLIQELVDKDIIRPSTSPWNAPLVVIPKKNGDLRLTVDFRKLNSVTKRPIFPIPDANQLFDTLDGSVLFTTLDLSSGYYNIPMKEEDIGKTAFSTRTDHWEFVRMPMGISTAPATFQRLMHKIFEKEKWQECLIYLDDILIFSNNIEQHIQRLKTIFSRVRESGVKLSPKKCKFLKTEVSYLGHTISREGIKTDKQKTDKVQGWPIPKSMEDLRSFLGLCGYYRKFIKDYGRIVKPLEEACKEKWNKKRTRKTSPLEWNDELNKAFVCLKVALTSAPILAFPSRNGRFILDTDASHDCIGAVLSQVQGSEEKVIAYASRKLSQSERQYCITRKELLSVYYFVTHFKHYLLGRQFTVRTDHRSLCWLLNWRDPNTSQYCRWRQELEIYDMEVQYRRGEKHINADVMSRMPDCGQCELKHAEPKKKRNFRILQNKETDQLYCRRIVTWEEEVDQTSDGDLKIIINLLKEGKVETEHPEEIKHAGAVCRQLWSMRKNLRFRGGLLYLVSDESRYRLVLPKNYKNEVVRTMHESLAHAGISKTLSVIKQNFYWVNIDLDVKLFIASCKYCAKRKCTKVPKHKMEKISGSCPFEKISIDIAGPLPASNAGERYILGVIDNYSRYAALIPLRNITSIEIAKKLFKHWIAIFGTPQSIHSDRGADFESELIKELCKILNIKKTKSSPYYPAGNGIVERLFRTVKDMIYATTSSSGQKWPDILPFIERALRCTKHAYTEFTPYEIIFGREMPNIWIAAASTKSVFKCHHEYITDMQKLRDRVENFLGQKRKSREANSIKQAMNGYNVGDRVMAKIFPVQRGILNPRFEGPYEVVQLLSKWSYRLKHCITRKEIDRNYYHVKRYTGKASNSQNMNQGSHKKKDTSIWSQSVTSVSAPQLIKREATEISRPRKNPHRIRAAPNRYGYSQ